MARKKCLNQKENEKKCPCTYKDCEYHGICCQCVRYHRKRKEKPFCLKGNFKSYDKK